MVHAARLAIWAWGSDTGKGQRTSTGLTRT